MYWRIFDYVIWAAISFYVWKLFMRPLPPKK